VLGEAGDLGVVLGVDQVDALPLDDGVEDVQVRRISGRWDQVAGVGLGAQKAEPVGIRPYQADRLGSLPKGADEVRRR
jgi:hypothetical protein